MSQYLDQQGLQTLVTKTKEYARKSAKDAVNTSAAAASKTITGWDATTSAAIYGDIKIAESQVTGLENDLALKAPLASPAFTGVPTVPDVDITASGSQQIANTKYVKDLVGNIGEAMHYKGAVDGSHPLPSSGYKAGDTYKVAAAGTYADKTCEVGDMIIAAVNYVEGSASNADWNVIQTNIDGAVSGPASATDGAFVLFDGTTGKLIKNSNVNPDSFKTVQTSAEFDGNVLRTIQKISQNANGEIAVTFQDIQTASTSQAGVTTLSSTSGDAENVAATPKLATDLYNALDGKKQDNLSFEGTYNAETNKVATETTVSNAIAALDAEVDSSDGTNVQVKVTEVDGKITAVNITDNTVNATDVSGIVEGYINGLDVEPISVDTSATITSISEEDGKISVSSSPIAITTSQITDFQATLNGKADKVSGATAGHLAALDANGNLTDAGVTSASFKTVQSAVSDPTASGDAVSFIDTISQDENGVITATKKTVQNASGSQPGLMSAADFTKLSQISTSANRVEVDANGVLTIDGTSAMGPISTDDITALF
jgi:hypothetical protein